MQDLQVPSSSKAQGTREDAKTFLQSFLAFGPVPSNEVTKSAEEEGISLTTLNRAKKELGVTSRRENAKGGGRGGGAWLWSLPEENVDLSKGNP